MLVTSNPLSSVGRTVILNRTSAHTKNVLTLQGIDQAFADSGYWELRNIHADFQGTVLTLHGTTKTFYLKQVAQSIVLKVAQGYKIVNQIKVDD